MAVSTASDFAGLLTRRTQLPASPSPSSSYCSGSEMFVKMLKSKSMRSSNRAVLLRCEAKDNLVCPVDKIGIDSKKSNLIALEQLKASAIDRYTKEKSCIAVIGLNHHTVPVEVREKLAIPEEQWAQAISELCDLNHIEEAAALSTCNRTEIYVVALSQHRGVREVTEWMSKISGIPVSELCHHRFLLYNKDATKHLFEVASGLDSAVLGEGQILAQVRQVKKLGQGVAGFGRKISGLFEHAIITGKRVRTETNIASGSVSVSSAAVELGQVKLPECSYDAARVLVIGAGKMGKLVIKHLAAKGCTKMVVVNRTEERVAALRKEFKDVEVIYKPLSEMMACASEADMVFTCTASDAPLFLKEHVEGLRPVNPKFGRRLFIDISIPRNVEPCVSELQTTEVYNVDDLKEVVAANKEDRQRKAMEAQSVISDELHKFEAWKDSLETVPTIKKLRAYMERIRASEVEKCMSKMGDVTDKQKKAIHDLSMGMLKKFLQGPMQHLRIDASDCCKPEDVIENMHAVNRMFDLEKEILLDTVRTKVERSQK